MSLVESEITELIRMIMSTAFDLDVEALAASSSDRRCQPVLEGAVDITGAWLGTVVLHMSESLASRCARRMFDLSSRPPTVQETREAVGELVNMTGGGIKALLSESGARLSLPVVGHADDRATRGPGTRQMGRFEYVCDGESLVVIVLELVGEANAETNASQ
jgi:CheY-specific phosphatase CheX